MSLEKLLDPAGCQPDDLEPERYEFRESPAYQFDVSRRDFCRIMGGGLLVMLVLPRELQAQESGREGRGGRGGQSLPSDVGAYIRIDEDGLVHAYSGKVEVGQGARTSLAQA